MPCIIFGSTSKEDRLRQFPSLAVALAAILTIEATPVAEACTRAVYLGPDERILTGRSMDWKLPIISNLWAFPRGMERNGAAGDRSVKWTSRYGSLAVSGYDISTADGMNEAGLVVNLLWEVEATYPEDDGVTPRISLSVFPQYLLDRYATVAEAVTDLRWFAQVNRWSVAPPLRRRPRPMLGERAVLSRFLLRKRNCTLCRVIARRSISFGLSRRRGSWLTPGSRRRSGTGKFPDDSFVFDRTTVSSVG
ncbi:MAG: linear amide C-N hydrolase [Chromatiaceae bacterium]